MKWKTKLDDYTPAEKSAFDSIHQVLARYNAQLSAGEDVRPPDYSDEQMVAYSQYREIWMTEHARQK